MTKPLWCTVGTAVSVVLTVTAFVKRFVVGMPDPPPYPYSSTFFILFILNGANMGLIRQGKWRIAVPCVAVCLLISVLAFWNVFF